jgi:hypothetical protein
VPWITLRTDTSDPIPVDTNILKIINGAGFIAVPMIAALFGLDWYFTRGGKSTKWLYIAVGGILSAVLYSYLAWTEPSIGLVRVSILWYFALAALAVVVYYALYLAHNGCADPPAPVWLLPTALLSYICLLSAIGVFSAVALARHDYLLLGGYVISQNGAVPNASLTLQDTNHASLRQTVTDSTGRFLVTLRYADYVKKNDVEKPAYLLVKAKDFYEQTLDLDGHPDEHMRISLSPR